MNAQAMAKRIELWPVDKLVPYARNARTHSDAQIAQIAASIAEFGFNNPILVDTNAGIIAGHGRLLAARKLKLDQVPVVVLDHLTETQKRAYILADNKLAELAGWDEEVLRGELAELRGRGSRPRGAGLQRRRVARSARRARTGRRIRRDRRGDPRAASRAGHPAWRRLAASGTIVSSAGTAATLRFVARLFEGKKANLVVTSPPYATQREYDPASGFKPVPPEEYSDWYRDVAANIAAILAPDGSYFLNIKEHADDGERHLYVKDLVIAHQRQWGWRFVDEFCWRKTDNGVPGGWNNRFKNAWEPVFHFCRQQQIKFRPEAVGHVSEDCFDYSPNNPKSTSGSGLLGTGARGSAATGSREPMRQRWPIHRYRAAEQRDRGEVREQPGFALRSIPARASRVLRKGIFGRR